jgi:alpha-mannosidase
MGEETAHNTSRMRRAENTARNGEERNAYNILVSEPVRKEIARKTQTYMGRIILKLILNKHDAGVWTRFI